MTNLTRSLFQFHPFHLVSPSPWPLYSSISMLNLTFSAVLTFHVFYFFNQKKNYGLISITSLTSFFIPVLFYFFSLLYNLTKGCLFLYYYMGNLFSLALIVKKKQNQFLANVSINTYFSGVKLPQPESNNFTNEKISFKNLQLDSILNKNL